MQTWCKCERCGTEDADIERTNVKMTGGYLAVLCNRCVNDWDAFAKAHPLKVEQGRLLANESYLDGLAAAQQPPSLEAWNVLVADQLRIEIAFHALAREFVQAGKPAAVEVQS